MFKNLLLEEDSDDSFSAGQEDVDIQVSISDFDSPKVNVQQVGIVEIAEEVRKLYHIRVAAINNNICHNKKLKIQTEKIVTTLLENKDFKDDKGVKIYAKDSLIVNQYKSQIKEISKVLEQMAKFKQDIMTQIGDKFKDTDLKKAMDTLKLLVGAIGASMISSKANAALQPIQTQKCPTLKEVKRTVKELDKVKKEYNSIENKTNKDQDKYNKIIKTLNVIKDNYQQCQRQLLYK